jgi:hypothetical protein
LAKAGVQTYTVLVVGGVESNVIRVWLTRDGGEYVIDSRVPLEVGGTVCANPGGGSSAASGNVGLLLASENQVGRGRREVECWFAFVRPRTKAGAGLQPPEQGERWLTRH